jgi:hypothetical protein
MRRKIPTETATNPPPTPTLTPTKAPLLPTKASLVTPVVTPGPAKPVVNCQINSNILISNRSGSSITLYLSGPASFSFVLGLDNNSVNVCAGTYNFTVNGTCNGVPTSGSGKISDGDNIYFSCD